MRALRKPTSHCSYLLALKIGVFRLRSSGEESTSCEEMLLRNGLNSVSYHDPILEPVDMLRRIAIYFVSLPLLVAVV